MDNNTHFRKNLLVLIKWGLIGLFIRLIVMPFTFHGSDLFFVYYSPFRFLSKGILDPYFDIYSHFPAFQASYYPPGTYYFFIPVLLCLKVFLPKLGEFYSIFEPNFFNASLNTVHYSELLKNADLMRTLFLFKVPYLLADFIIGYFLVLFLKGNTKQQAAAFKLWMLNPFVLHSCYMVGQFDIISTLFVIIAVCFMLKNRPYLSIIFLSLAAGTKGYPVLLIPPAILLMGESLKKKVKLLFVSLFSTFLIVSPFILKSSGLMLGSFYAYNRFPFMAKLLFSSAYILWLLLLVFLKKENRNKMDYIVPIFCVTLLILYIFYSSRLRQFVLVTPFLIYLALKNKRFWIYNILFFITLFLLRTAGNTQQWGLFAALQPEFFSSLPILDSYLNLTINVKYIHQFLNRLFFASGFIMIIHILIINRKFFRFLLPIRVRNEKS